jgi:hypothetical protein
MSERARSNQGGGAGGGEHDPNDPQDAHDQQRALKLAVHRRRMQNKQSPTGAAEEAPSPLDAQTRERMERRYGEDLSRVTIHPGSSRATGPIQALAEGDQIHFAPGLYAPGTEEGDRLLAHELAHVAQQRAGQRGEHTGAHATDGAGSLEQDAERAADGTVANEPTAVQGRAPHGKAQHYEAWEHRQIGDGGTPAGGRTIKTQCGIELSFGQVVALAADHYGTPRGVLEAPREELEAILKTMAKEEHYAFEGKGKVTAGQAAQVSGEYQDATRARERPHIDATGTVQARKDGSLVTQGEKRGEPKSFQSLAKDNSSHFAPQNMLEHWRLHHGRAREIATYAHEAISGGASTAEEWRERLNEALVHEGFAAHFLSDAFSAGHLINAAKLRELALDLFRSHRHKIIGNIMSVRGDPRRVGGLVRIIIGTDGFAENFGSLATKVLHDKLNETGLLVSNALGQSWRTAGDGDLGSSPTTRELATKAVKASRDAVEQIALTGKSSADPLLPEQLTPSSLQLPATGAVMKLAEFASNPAILIDYLKRELIDAGSGGAMLRLIEQNLWPYLKGVLKDKGLDLAETQIIKRVEDASSE